MYKSNQPSFHYISKSALCALAICIMLFGLWLTDAQAAPGIVNGSVVNIRSAPSSGSEILGTLLKDAQVELLGISGDWYEIKYASLQGYIARELITLPAATTTSSSSAPSVILNGSKMQFEVAPRIENGRTLVPLRAIFEAMGANVEWNETSRTVTARKNSTTVVLPLGSANPTVNGKAWTLEVPAKIVNDRTLAPLRFVGEAFGGTVDWNEQTRTITIAYTASAPPAAVLIASGSVNLRESPSPDATIIVVAPAGERMTVLAEKDGWYQVSRGSRTAWVASWVVEPLTDTIAVPEPDPTDNPAPVTPSKDGNTASSDVIPTNSDINSHGNENAAVAIGSIAISTRLGSDGYRLVMKTGEATEPTITESRDGKKIIYTFKKTVLPSNRDEASFYIGNGKNARVPISAQTMDDTTWVTIEMPLAYQYTSTSEANGCKQVFTITSQLTSVEDITLKNGNQIIVLRATSAMEYQESFSKGTIQLSLNKTGPGFVEDSYLFSGVANRVSIAENGGKQSVLVKVNTNSNLDTYQVSRNLSGDRISIILVNKEITPNTEPATNGPTEVEGPVTIVIDPGHGGRDTGAISKSRTLNEKDVVLKIGLKVQEILKQAGYKVVMTREDDTYIGLSERPAIANRAGADVFVSIHCDSVDSTQPHGTGTFYYAPEANQTLYAQEYQRSLLADLIQKAMLEKCGRTDRSIRQANYAVLRETTMPSALVETAFISNPDEEQLLASAAFQTQAAEAIAAGIQKYVKLML